MNQSLVLLWSPSGTSALVCGSHPANDAQPDGLNSVSFTIKVDKAAIIFTTFKDRKRKDLNLSLQSSFLGKLPRESQFYIFPCVKIRSLHFFLFFPQALYTVAPAMNSHGIIAEAVFTVPLRHPLFQILIHLSKVSPNGIWNTKMTLSMLLLILTLLNIMKVEWS